MGRPSQDLSVGSPAPERVLPMGHPRIGRTQTLALDSECQVAGGVREGG